MATCFYAFESLEAFIAAFVPRAEELQADMQRHTDIPAEIQSNEILIQR